MPLDSIVFLRRKDLVKALNEQGFFYAADLMRAGLKIDEHDGFRLVRVA